jgi:hypothetical protein
MTIKEQIDALPFDLFTRERIKQLVTKAGSYDLNESEKIFSLRAAFSWTETTEGGEYWYEKDLALYDNFDEIQD